MCYSTSTLIYGLWVTTSSLVFAATAHHQSRPPFLALELIARRRQTGTLQASSRVVDVPPEVWEVIKQELLELEMKQAEAEAIDALRCEDCQDEDRLRSYLQGSLLGEDEVVVEHQWDSWNPPTECGDCWETIHEVDEILPITKEREKAISELLDQYELDLASLNVHCAEEPYDEQRDFDSTLAITLPFRSSTPTEHPHVQADCEHEPEYASAHAVANISAEILNLPVNIERRFASLVKTYGLKVVDRATQDILPSYSRDASKVGPVAQRGKGKGKAKQPVNELRFGYAEPRWMLWSTYESCGM